MSDRLEEIKESYHGPTMPCDIEWLIAEVERLGEEFDGLSEKSLKHICRLEEVLAEKSQMQKQIESLTQERDEIKKTLDFAGTVAQADNQTTKKLEAENSILDGKLLDANEHIALKEAENSELFDVVNQHRRETTKLQESLTASEKIVKDLKKGFPLPGDGGFGG